MTKKSSLLLAAALMASLAGTVALAAESEALQSADGMETAWEARHPGHPGHPGRPDRPNPGYPPAPPPPPSRGGDYVFQPMHQYLVGANTLALRQILNLGPEMRGRAVEYVVLRARTDAGRGVAQLEINGFRVGHAQQVDTWTRDYFFHVNPSQNRLGEDIQTLQLELQGRFTVEGVGVKLGRDHGFAGSETRVLQQRFSGNSRIDLGFLFRGREHLRVRSVTIRASTAAGHGQARVCSGFNNCSMAQTVATYMGSYTFPLFGGNSLGDMFVDLQGNFWIDSVTVDFDRRF
ncbi:MAG: hypothetical protein HUU37_06180 [Bdellovibrionales bacterium]|nr:hypothetical protein [Bdellovibrionales bacterium]